MKNLKRLTKDQLITQLQNKDNAVNQNKTDVVKNIKQNKTKLSIWQKFIELFVLLKTILLSITLITFLIKIFKKYKLIRTVLKFLNVLIIGIFGIDLYHNWSYETIFRNLWLWFKLTAIYIWFARLFGFTTTSDNPRTGWEVKPGVIPGEPKYDWESRPKFDWNSPVPIESTQSDNTHIYITVILILIGLGLSYYYKDDIYKLGESLLGRKPGNPPADTAPTDNIVGGIANPEGFVEQATVERNIFDRIKNVFFVTDSNVNLKQSVKDKFYNTDSDNGSVETLKPAYTSKSVKFESPVASSSKVTVEDLREDTFFKDSNIDVMTNRMVQAQLTGESYLDFEDKSGRLMAEISTFLSFHKIGNFPSLALQQALYHSLRASLYKLSLNERWYDKWLNEPNVENKIDEFIRIESDVYGENNPDECMGEEFVKTYKSLPSPDNIVEQVAKEMEKVERPKFNSLFDAINARRNDKDVVGSPPIRESESEIVRDDEEMLYSNYSVDELQTQNYKNELSPILAETINENISMAERPMADQNTTNLKSDSLFEEIKNRRASMISPTPNQNLEDWNDDGNQTDKLETIEITNTENKPSFTNLFQSIKSLRKEYGTPIVESRTLETVQSNVEISTTQPKVEAVDSIFEDTAALFDDDTLVSDDNNMSTPVPPNSPQLSAEIDDWKDVKTNIDDSIVNIEFGNLWRQCKTVLITTNDGVQAECNFNHDVIGGPTPHKMETLDLKKVITWNSDTHVKSIVAIDVNNNVIPVYTIKK